MLKDRTLIRDTVSKIGEQVTLYGWANAVRDHGKVGFIDLRDRTGLIQIVFYGENYKKLQNIKAEFVLEIKGLVKNRNESQFNENIVTGKIELDPTELTILNTCEDLPIPIDTDGSEINEESRLKYRYLDLRRERMRNTLKLRSNYIKELRKNLGEMDFTEVETPMLTKATKEGARDFVVPSRFYPGKFYSLPQSPQQYKQLLMTAGVEKYFQFAKCIRDEDLRADRGFEHTQVDLEISFVDREDVMEIVEDLVKKSVKAVGGKLKFEEFPVIDYKDALKKYGADKFDLRTEQDKKDGLLAFAWVINFPFFKRVDKADKAEVIDGKSGWTFTHNPFSNPIPEHIEQHLKGENVGEILTTQYDLVCNGFEAGGGSIRAHNPEVLKATFKIMGYSDSEIEENVGHMLQAFKLGTPPHGGIALGLDRHVMILVQEESLKEAIAFPMTSRGKTSVMDAPTNISNAQLKELGLQVKKIK